MKVYKFGGTSAGSAERIKALLPLTINGDSKIVVLSAMAGTTNDLVRITELLFNSEKAVAAGLVEEMRQNYYNVVNDLLSKPEIISEGMELINCHFDHIRGFTLKDFSKGMARAIVAQGELISTALFRLYAVEQGIKATLLPALSYMRIDKDGEPDMYYITQNLKRELSGHIDSQLIITQGFICRNAFGEVDNLKRGGSDYTATIIGAAINAEEVQIWTDINGVHNNDPRYVENTSVIRQLSFDEAAELAYFGAKILHPSSVNPARMKNIPVRLKNTMEPKDEGTLIWTQGEGRGYKAVAAKDGISVVKIKSDRMLMAYGFLRKVFEIFEIYKTPIDMITTSEVAVSLTIDNIASIGRIVEELEQFGTVEVDRNQSIICIVGNFIAEEAGTTLEIFSALKDIPVRMISYGGSRHNVSIVVDSALKVAALKSLSANLFNLGKDV
ncbi:MAG: aspartate kinase [Bacteroidia bacterium]|nr:MAG: aspartate kinase [Bacteroidia bacterium]